MEGTARILKGKTLAMKMMRTRKKKTMMKRCRSQRTCIN